MILSVIICTYNRQKYIYNCLKSIAENDFDYSNYEIILINNNSNDDTEGECSRFVKDFYKVSFRYFVETQQGLSYARNRGIIESKGDILVYVDDDATVNKEYLKTIFDFFCNTPQAMAAGGAIFPVYETQEPEWMSIYTKELITAYKYEGDKIIQLKGNKFPSGGNAAYRKEVFQKTGNFNIKLGRNGNLLISGEEKAIFYKMKAFNMPIFYLPDMILYHIIPAGKLTEEYFNDITISIGKSERLRTMYISQYAYFRRIIQELIKWAAAILLCFGFCLQLTPQKGIKLLIFRWNVSKGLLKKE